MRRSSACVLASIIALALGHSPGVRAAGPDVFSVPVDDTSSFEACDFPVENHTTGAIRIDDFFDEQGNLVREVANYNLKITYTNSLTGESVTSRSAGPDILQVNPDNSANLMSIGLLARIVLPGQGLLAVQTGRLVLFFTDPGDQEPDVLFGAGPHDENTSTRSQALGYRGAGVSRAGLAFVHLSGMDNRNLWAIEKPQRSHNGCIPGASPECLWGDTANSGVIADCFGGLGMSADHRCPQAGTGRGSTRPSRSLSRITATGLMPARADEAGLFGGLHDCTVAQTVQARPCSV